jgi:3-hydroxy acid dehydrogenase/malonic semialdehyde reductase
MNVLITGATSGFGKELAKLFHQNGWKVIICGRRAERLEALVQELGTIGIYAQALDVRDKTAVFDFVQNIPQDLQPIDLLINNAGLALGLETAENASLDDWEQMIDTNIKGLIYMTKAVLPQMIAKGEGQIINIGSVAGSYSYPGANVYGASKAFVKQFSLNLRSDLVGKNIRVCDIEPGMAHTEFSVVRFKGNEEQASKVYQGVQPLTATDIANTALWIAQQPKHININRIEMMASCQAFGPFQVVRQNH